MSFCTEHDWNAQHKHFHRELKRKHEKQSCNHDKRAYHFKWPKKRVCWAIKKTKQQQYDRHGDPIKAGRPAPRMKDPRYKGLARVDILSDPTFYDDEIVVAGTSSQTT